MVVAAVIDADVPATLNDPPENEVVTDVILVLAFVNDTAPKQVNAPAILILEIKAEAPSTYREYSFSGGVVILVVLGSGPI